VELNLLASSYLAYALAATQLLFEYQIEMNIKGLICAASSEPTGTGLRPCHQIKHA